MANNDSVAVLAVSPPGPWAERALWLLSLLLPLAITMAALGMALGSGGAKRLIDGSPTLTATASVLLVLACCLPLSLWLRRRLRCNQVQLIDGQLQVCAGGYRQQLALSDFDLQKARVVDLAEHPELRPWLKTNGIGLPGYQAGHYRLRDPRRRAFCLLTQPRRVLCLPERDGRLWLLSLQQPQRALEFLRQLSA